MATITESKPKKGKKAQTGKAAAPPPKLSKAYVVLALSGAALGLSAPGIDQWYFAWFALAPLIVSLACSNGIRDAFFRALIFSTAYNLVYDNWLLGLQPLNWLGFNAWQGWLLAIAAWLVIGIHQGLITGLFAVICRLVPLTGGYLPKKSGKGFTLPVLLTLPLIWVLMHHIVGNAHDALGVPWSMLEYSQYEQKRLIQVASLIGGIGICSLIVFWNTVLASLVVSLLKIKNAKFLAVDSREHAFYNTLFAAIGLTLLTGAGLYAQSIYKVPATEQASVVQSNINIDMQKSVRRYSLDDLWTNSERLAQRVPPGVCVWSENSLPTYLNSEPEIQNRLAHLARSGNLNLIIGALDRDSASHPFNSAYGISSDGKLLNVIYHKRYLVPFGEYTPALVQYFPEWVKRLTNTPAGSGFSSGKQPAVLNFRNEAVAPLICFETLSPEIVASSVRTGGQLLVNISDLAWFHQSIVGRQMLAFSVLRAVENRRYFIFAANTGPSGIIDSDGYIKQISPLDKADVLKGRIGLNSKLTPFTRWFIL